MLLAGPPDVAKMAALGRAHLALGDLDGAVSCLQAATAAAPGDAVLQADLARAFLRRAEQLPLSEDVLAAVDAADVALGLRGAPEDVQALLGEGLARLGLPVHPPAQAGREAARERFRAAFARGDAAEAANVVAEDPSGFRDWLERELLPGWGEHSDAGALALAREAAVRLSEATGDPHARELVEGAGPGTAAGFLRYRDARILLDRFDVENGRRAMEAARAALEEAHSPLAHSAQFYLAVADYYAQDRKAASERLETLLPKVDGAGYRVLGARVRQALGLIDAVESRLSSALRRYQAAEELYTAAREKDAALYVRTLIAECHRLLGDPGEEWRIHAEILPALSGVHEARSATQALLDAADCALRLGHPRAALRLQDGAMAAGAEQDAEAWVWRARVELALGGPRDATRDLARAQTANGEQEDGALASRTGAEIQLVQAAALLGSDPRRSLALLDRAEGYFESAGLEARLPEVHLQRARAALALDRQDEAERELGKGIEAYERDRQAVEGGSEQASYFERAQDLFDAMVAFQLDRRGDPDTAFRYAERARSAAHPATPREIARGLPAGTLLLDFVVLPTRVLAWALRAEGVRFAVREIAAGELARLVADLSDPVDDVRAERGARALERLLLAPFRSEISRAHAILFVPDKDLHRVPFARLHAEPGAFLVENVALATLPRAAWATRREAARPEPGEEACRVLVVGDPAAGGTLSRLPGARLEARAVAATWPGADLLVGQVATKDQFLRALPASDLVHFAGHGVLRPVDPARSFLALASDAGNGDGGALEAREIEGLRLPRAPLVVLSGCETGGGPLVRAEGALSLARPFLSAGASQVVASLWPIDDASSSRFFGEFHRRLQEGACPMEALRATQLFFLHHADPQLRVPRAWAAFTVFGFAEDSSPQGGVPCPFRSSCSSAASSSSSTRRHRPTQGPPTTTPATPIPRTRL